MSVGSKIRNLRKKYAMTQKELADGIITCGMLSRIENGTALPSMQTLHALSERLGISAGFLLEDSDDLLPAEQSKIEKEILAAYKAGNLRSCMDIFAEAPPVIRTNLAEFFVSSAFAIALEEFYKGNFTAASSLLAQMDEIPPGLLPLRDVSAARTSFLRSAMEHIHAPEDFFANLGDRPDFGFQPALFAFICKLILAKQPSDARFLMQYGELDETYLAYLRALLLIDDYKFIDALLEMKSLLANQTCPVFLKLLCYSRMEHCCKLCEDYKGAYENHLRYRELLDSIR